MMETPIPVPELLLAILEELITEELKTFQWYLTQVVLSDFPPFPKSKLENTDRLTTVDKMIKTSSYEGAVKVSLEILRKMNHNNLAEKLQRDSQISCPVCHDILRDPVILLCHHKVCTVCLHEFWNQKDSRQCPVCKKRILMDTARSEVLCSLHSEKFKLFCLEDKKPICVVCQTSKKHKSHNCSPIDEAAQDQKEELQTALNSLKEKLGVYSKISQTCAEHILSQAQHTEGQIKVQFEKLHQFLREEEAARIAELKDEEEHKNREMKENIEEMSGEISSLANTIRFLEEELKAEDLSFLQNYESTKERAQCKLPDPMLISGVLIDVAKYLGNLQFRVWEKMHEIVKYTPVILNPNTSQPHLILSDDLTSVRHRDEDSINDSDETRQFPDNPERFDTFRMVLGSEGFNSGTHNWDIEVGDNTHWSLGVISESVQRKEEVKNGYWQIRFTGGKYDTHSPSGSDTLLTVRQKPLRIRVQLDWDGGKLSFSDPDNKTVLHTFTHTFTEKVFPFCLNGCKLHPVRILPVKACVTVEKPNETFLQDTHVRGLTVNTHNDYDMFDEDIDEFEDEYDECADPEDEDVDEEYEEYEEGEYEEDDY
ncbi:E3 ubiquitin-protein ligase TRIM39-like [Oncorhynchus masou masou]|uniref:E3 ubiquitin-protein ligase TRIM39-like n=1 Tax=Oncorhynchus masou masou TaxID=90313 RepID=UPI0031832B17